MTWLLARKLIKLGKKADPDPDFVDTLESRIKEAMDQQNAGEVQGGKSALEAIKLTETEEAAN